MTGSARWVVSSVVALVLLIVTSARVLADNPHGGGTDTPELPSVVLVALPLVVAGAIWRLRHRR